MSKLDEIERKMRKNSIDLEILKYYGGDTDEDDLPEDEIGGDFDHYSVLKHPSVERFMESHPFDDPEESMREAGRKLNRGFVSEIQDWKSYQEGPRRLESYATHAFQMTPWRKNPRTPLFDELPHQYKVNVTDNESVSKKSVLSSTRHYYALTQHHLENILDGKSHIVVYRGVGEGSYDKFRNQGLGVYDHAKLGTWNLSSWTVDRDVAEEFAKLTADKGLVFAAKVPKEKVFSHPDLYEHFNEEDDLSQEREVILMGNSHRGIIDSMWKHGRSVDPEEDEYEKDDEDNY